MTDGIDIRDKYKNLVWVDEDGVLIVLGKNKGRKNLFQALEFSNDCEDIDGNSRLMILDVERANIREKNGRKYVAYKG